jgi:NAD(P)-dependent dehydrogenase (short-subunit alcohol dehydrogenase family)
MAPTVAFVTGANRGLGFGLVKQFVAISNYVSYVSLSSDIPQELIKPPH